jgi:hypothetical protein
VQKDQNRGAKVFDFKIGAPKVQLSLKKLKYLFFYCPRR